MDSLELKEFFVKIAKDRALTLANSVKEREDNRESIKNGVLPDNDRMKWVRETTADLIKLMAFKANDYDRSHEGNIITNGDLFDVVNLTLATLNNMKGK